MNMLANKLIITTIRKNNKNNNFNQNNDDYNDDYNENKLLPTQTEKQTDNEDDEENEDDDNDRPTDIKTILCSKQTNRQSYIQILRTYIYALIKLRHALNRRRNERETKCTQTHTCEAFLLLLLFLYLGYKNNIVIDFVVVF